MKNSILIYILVFLSSCSVIDSNRIAPGYVQAFKAIKSATLGTENTDITLDLIDRIPYASLLVRIGNGPSGLMILESIEGNKSTWVSADGIYFVIQNGRIIKTQGLQNNLTNTNLPYLYSNSSFLEQSDKQNLTFYYSYDKPFLANLELTASYDIGKPLPYQLLTQNIELTPIKESLNNKQIYWKHINRYWIDEYGFTWKSEQFISPKLPKIYIEVTKKPSS